MELLLLKVMELQLNNHLLTMHLLFNNLLLAIVHQLLKCRFSSLPRATTTMADLPPTTSIPSVITTSIVSAVAMASVSVMATVSSK